MFIFLQKQVNNIRNLGIFSKNLNKKSNTVLLYRYKYITTILLYYFTLFIPEFTLKKGKNFGELEILVRAREAEL